MLDENTSKKGELVLPLLLAESKAERLKRENANVLEQRKMLMEIRNGAHSWKDYEQLLKQQQANNQKWMFGDTTDPSLLSKQGNEEDKEMEKK